MKKSRVINTVFGKVQGYKYKDITIFKGLPYAMPPIGDLRFSPPEPLKSWNGILKAYKVGPYAPQGYTLLEENFGKCEFQSENNCLNLNIWAPCSFDQKKPVMIYIHGGSFIFGGNADKWFGIDGMQLALNGNIVVVTLNYRLGAFGFLYVPDKVVNIGILDQIAALKWIKENIESFGGDPENITIFGESAGGLSVEILISNFSQKGLFNKAIIQSAPILDTKPAIRSTEALFKEFGVAFGDIESLRKLSSKKIIKVQNKIIAKWVQEDTNEIMDFRPSIDGKIIRDYPFKALKQGSGKNIDIIIGTNQNECNLWTVQNPLMQNLDWDGLVKVLSTRLNKFGNGEFVGKEETSKRLIQEYKNIQKEKYKMRPIDIYNLIDTDFTFRIPAVRFCELQCLHNEKAYQYVFNWPSPALNGEYGACHILELPYVFGTLDNTGVEWFFGSGKEAETVSSNMMQSWVKFAYNGNPNHNNIPNWAPYNETERCVMMIDNPFQLIKDHYKKILPLWEDFLLF